MLKLTRRSISSGLVIFLGLLIFYTIKYDTQLPIPETPTSLDIYALIDQHDLDFALWGRPINDKMMLREYEVAPNDNFWGLVEREKLHLSPAFKKELLSSHSMASQALRSLRPKEKIAFVSDNRELNYILVEKDHDDFLIAQNQVRALKAQQQHKQQAMRFDIKIHKSIAHDLTAHKVPGPVRQSLITALATRFNLNKEVYKGNRLHLVYGRDASGQWQLYKFSFSNGKKSLKAYAYQFDGCHFVDEHGIPLKKGFLEKPVEPSYISSYYSKARKHPVLGFVRAHKGIDFAAPKGTPVRAASEGKVVFMGVRGGYGNLLEIDHGFGIKTRYGHLDSFTPRLKIGDSVDQGQVIGAVGMTGLATGPHLHYEYVVNGEPLDPLKAQKNICRKLASHDNIAFQKVRARYDEMEQSLPITIKM